MTPVRQRDATRAGRSAPRHRGSPVNASHSPVELARALQRTAGNAAVNRALVPRLLRTPRRAPIQTPGTGFDGIRTHYGSVFDRNLSPAQIEATTSFRTWMEAGFSETSGYAKGSWAREAGARAAAFPGSAAARAELYAEFQRQIVQATGGGGSDWIVSAERGADGSWIFRGNPGLEKQRVFVVDKDGNCFAGEAEGALEGRGPGKRVNYGKLRQIGGAKPPGGGSVGGGGGGEPAGAGPKVEPKAGGEPVGGGAKPEPEVKPGTSGGRVGGAPEPEGFRISLKGVGMFGLQLALLWWLGSRAEKAESESLEKIMAAKVTPKVNAAMEAQAATAQRMTDTAPEIPVYATVTVDFDYTWTAMGIGGTPSREHVYDARFVDLTLGSRKGKTKESIIRDDKETSLLGSDTYHDATRRVTWVSEVDFGETAQARHYRAHLKHAEDVVKRGMSARSVAESSHFDEGSLVETRKDQDAKRLGLKTGRQLREEADRIMFVRAYIEYTAYHGPDDQYTAAIAYLHELEARQAGPPKPDPLRKLTAPMGPKERQQLVDFINAGG